ncbi:coiled-coil domain-containing protein 115 isoform X1 [Gadus macrocephalus]|uniref:coiled-coil domain-containing protein 115 isoform X1 n=1 Tax=Gadus macrocephalus TaxID=80720 RepID=UPI0028CB8AD8|nr:coiled-coil domain-containing protein 115 isoform X1 [Gadus macrocephalus]
MGLSKTEETSLLLDEQLLQYMDQLESLQEKRSALNTLIEQGWFSLSKARYSMGNKQVSSLQYASEMEPQIFVHARAVENDALEFCTERITIQSPTERVQNTTSVEDIGPKEEGVRRRIKASKDMAEPEELVGASAENPSPTSTKPPSGSHRNNSDQNPQADPLKWFGILVPQTLKQAQSSFRQVIELSAEIATLQAAVLKTREEFKLALKLSC